MTDIIYEWLKAYTMFAGFVGLVLFGLLAAVLLQLAAMTMGRKAEIVCEQFFYNNRSCYVEYNDHTGEIASMVDAKTGQIIPRPESLRVNLSGNSPTLVIDNDDKQR